MSELGTAATAHRHAVRVDDLAALAARPGPFLSVHLATEGAVANPGDELARRWQALRQRLEADGAPTAPLDAVGSLVDDAHLAGDVLSLVTDAEGRVLVAERLGAELGEDTPADRAMWSPLPDLLPLLAWRQDHPPHVLVWADRGGAEVHVRGDGVRSVDAEVGDDDPQRKVAPGGWSQARYQRRADDDWARTAAEVADEVRRLAEEVDARLVVVGGDQRARGLIVERLPERLVERIQEISPGRAADGSDEDREVAVRRLLATVVAEDTVAVLERAREELGQHDRAVQGADATVDALNRAAVELLLVSDAGDDERTAWVGSDPVPVGLGDSPATAFEAPARAPLTAALVRAALGTGASVRVVPHHGPLDDGVGALLRWSAPSR